MKTIQAFDIETTGLKAFRGAKVFAFCIGHMDGTVEVWRLDGKDKKDPALGLKRLETFLADTSIEKVCHNVKFEYSILKENGFIIPENTVWHDTMLMSQILQNNNPHHSLDYLAWQFGQYPTDLDDIIVRMGKEYGGWQNIPVNKMYSYQVSDGERTVLLFRTFYPYFENDSRLMADYREEILTVTNTYQIERRGIMVHWNELAHLEEWLKDEVSKIQDDLYKSLGEYLNLNSPQQVSHILFKKLKLPIIKISEESRQAKTGKDVLFELKKISDHPVIDLIMKQRSYTKGIGTLKNYKKHAIGDIIHPNIKTNFALTGREASSEPNLQNVSKEEALKNPFPVPARKCFRPRLGFVFILFDYAGIEMRLIVEVCGEEELLTLANSGGDLHTPAAGLFFQDRFLKEEDKGKKKILRTASKNGQFGIAYGADFETLATTLMLSIPEAIAAKERYSQRFPKVANYATSTADEIRQKGYIENVFGRKLYINREMAYMGANYRIQSAAAGILKRGQNNIYRNIINKDASLKDKLFVIMPIHDELIIEVSRELLPYRDELCQRIAHEMTSIPGIRVRLDAETKITTTTWNNAKEFNFYGK